MKNQEEKLKVYFHIGFEKTGSTAIQHFLKDNAESFFSNMMAPYFCFGKTDNRLLVSYSKTNPSEDFYLRKNKLDQRECYSEFCDEVEADVNDFFDSIKIKGIECVVVSSELFGSQVTSKSEVERLLSLFKPHADQFGLICYFRDQVDLLCSHYSTELKSSGKRSLRQKAQKELREDSLYFNYEKVVDSWAGSEFFSDKSIKAFEESHLYEGDVVKDFLNIIDYPLKDLSQLPVPRKNVSLSCFGQFILRSLNIIESGDEFSSDEVRRVKLKAIKSFEGKGEVLPPDDELEYRERFSSINERLNLFFDSSNKADKKNIGNYHTDDQYEVIEKFFSLLRKKSGIDDKYADSLRISAAKLRSKEPRLSLELLEIAKTIRPEGKLINNLYNDISLELKNEE